MQTQRIKNFGDFTELLSFCHTTVLDFITKVSSLKREQIMKTVPSDMNIFTIWVFSRNVMFCMLPYFVPGVPKQENERCWSIFQDQLDLVKEFASNNWELIGLFNASSPCQDVVLVEVTNNCFPAYLWYTLKLGCLPRAPDKMVRRVYYPVNHT